MLLFPRCAEFEREMSLECAGLIFELLVVKVRSTLRISKEHFILFRILMSSGFSVELSCTSNVLDMALLFLTGADFRIARICKSITELKEDKDYFDLYMLNIQVITFVTRL